MEKILFFCSGQQAFWKQFDAWQTDSCTVGDDFFMHMIGSWWKNPVDVYPNGLLGYAGILNNQRVNEIKQTNANLQHLKKHLEDNLAISTEEIEQMVQAKVDELWAGATTREEALAALGRAWAQGYFNKLEPIVNIVDGVPTWQVTGKLPTFISADQISKNKEEWWRLFGTHQTASMTGRRAQNAAADQTQPLTMPHTRPLIIL